MNQRKHNERIQIVQEICKAAKLYKNHLVGKKFLYIFDGRFIEVCYKANSFRHLTGVETNLSAKRFYQYAVNNRLQSSQIYFSNKHPFDLCKRKIKHIGEIAVLASNENFILEEIVTDTKTYKFGTTDLKFTLCMNKEYDDEGKEKSECYIVESLRDEDCFSRSKNAYEVTHILSKDNDAKQYSDLIFIDKKSRINDLSKEILALLADNLKAEK